METLILSISVGEPLSKCGHRSCNISTKIWSQVNITRYQWHQEIMRQKKLDRKLNFDDWRNCQTFQWFSCFTYFRTTFVYKLFSLQLPSQLLVASRWYRKRVSKSMNITKNRIIKWSLIFVLVMHLIFTFQYSVQVVKENNVLPHNSTFQIC